MNKSFSLIFILVFFSLSSSAFAQTTYGPWFPDPSTNNSRSQYYRADIQPLGGKDTSEVVSFACVYDNGYPIPDNVKGYIDNIITNATRVYQGDYHLRTPFQPDPFALDTGEEEKPKGTEPHYNLPKNQMEQAIENSKSPTYFSPYPDPGKKSMTQYLEHQVEFLKSGRWRKIEGAPSLEVTKDVGKRPQLAKIIEAMAEKASRPVALSFYLPAGCFVHGFDVPAPEFGDLDEDPAKFFSHLVLYGPAYLTNQSFNYISPYALSYTFWTPHSERGDTFFNVARVCKYFPDEKPGRAVRASIDHSCDGAKPLGFDKRKFDTKKQRSWYISLAFFLQWLLSAAYFLILFASALVYMVRGNRASSFSVIKIIPRLLLSIILTIFAPWLIGTFISISNLLTKQILTFGEGQPSINVVNTLVQYGGDLIAGNGTSDFLATIIQLASGVVAVVFFAIFILASLARQVILIALIVLAPLATFSLLLDKWRPNFNLFVRVLIAVLLLPVVLALVLRLGIIINPAFTNPQAILKDSSLAMISLLILLATFMLMGKSIRLVKAWADGQGISVSRSAQALGLAGKGVAKTGGGISAVGRGVSRTGNFLGAIPVVGTAAAVGAKAVGTGIRGVGAGVKGSGKAIEKGARASQKADRGVAAKVKPPSSSGPTKISRGQAKVERALDPKQKINPTLPASPQDSLSGKSKGDKGLDTKARRSRHRKTSESSPNIPTPPTPMISSTPKRPLKPEVKSNTIKKEDNTKSKN